jgi:hypothetical protein
MRALSEGFSLEEDCVFAIRAIASAQDRAATT